MTCAELHAKLKNAAREIIQENDDSRVCPGLKCRKITWSMREKRDWVRQNALNSHSARRNTRAAQERAESLRCCSASKGENSLSVDLCVQKKKQQKIILILSFKTSL